MRKGDEIFSMDEFAALKNFAKNALKEDKRLHGIQDNKFNQQNQFTQKKEEKKPPPVQNKPIKKQEPPKQITKKEEKPIKKNRTSKTNTTSNNKKRNFKTSNKNRK